MATAKVPKRVVKQPFYFGKKLTQVGKKKGFTKTSFIYIEEDAAKAMSLTFKLPKSIPGAVYEVKDGIINQTSTNVKGIVITKPVSVKNGSKTVTVQLKKTETKTIRSHGKSAEIVGYVSLSFGVPSWATLTNVSSFLKNASGVKSFSISGGRNRLVGKGGAE